MAPNWKNYQGKILRRCDLCGKFHAKYRVEDPRLGSLQICHDCWSRRQKSAPGEATKEKTDDSPTPT
jgi:ribosomal protein S14